MTLTKVDLKSISDLIDYKIDTKLDEKLDEKIGYLPTRDEFYSKMDEVMGELKDMREEFAAATKLISRNTGRIEKLEKIHPSGRHATI